ncbi:TPA: hypothetical protein ACVTE6_000067 [Salmonella enterica subsp. enterica]|uniref:ParE family toxin-like protein n=1 Tax=Salmonella enterica TaxID=28901 RepID=UPI003EBBD66B
MIMVKMNKVPLRICQKAAVMLNQWQMGKIKASTNYTQNMVLRVSYRWRLLSRDHGMNWELMSHEKYNSRVNKQ